MDQIIEPLVEEASKNIGEKVENLVKKKYEGFKIVSACISTFSKLGATETVLALLHPKTLKGVYVVAMENTLVEQSHKYKMEIKALSLEVRCRPWTEVERFKKEMDVPDQLFPNVNFKLLHQLEVLCISPFANKFYEFECYQFDQKIKAFTSVGGWSS